MAMLQTGQRLQVHKQYVPSEFQAFVSDDGGRVRLGERNLKVVPEWIRTLTALTTLELQGNRLTTLPEWLSSLAALATLDLSRNLLARLPDTVGGITTLRTLDLSGNQLTTLRRHREAITALPDSP